MQQKSKVVWCISKYALPPVYGAQGRLFYIARELGRAGYESYVFTSSTNHLVQLPFQKEQFKKKHTEEGVQYVSIKGIKYGNSVAKKRVLSWLIFEIRLLYFILFGYKKYVKKPDSVIVSSLSLLTILNGYIAKRKFGCRLIFEIRDIWPLSAILVAGHSTSHPFIRFLQWVEKFGYKNADIVTSPLPNLPEHIKTVIGREVSFQCIPQGFDSDSLQKQEILDDAFLAQYIPKNKFIVGYIGNIVSAYDLDTLVACARQLHQTHNHIHFLILGDGDYKETLVAKCRDINNVTFIPRIAKSKVQSFLERCDVVSNFLRPEPLFKFGVSPQKLVDYMLAGKPIIMSYTGFTTIIEEVKCGTVVEAANIKKLCEVFVEYSTKTKDELAITGVRGQEYLLGALSWTNIVKQYIKIIQ